MAIFNSTAGENNPIDDNIPIDDNCYSIDDEKVNYNISQYNSTIDDNSFCSDTDLSIAYLSLPILLISLANGHIIRSFYKSLDQGEKNIIVFLDMAITNYLQEIKVFLFFIFYYFSISYLFIDTDRLKIICVLCYIHKRGLRQ